VPPKTSRAGEFELIARYFAPLAQGVDGALGLRDDAAWLAPEPGTELVVTTDALVEGVHFLPDDPPELVARKALRVNLSDLAAKGAVPRVYFLDAVLPQTFSETWLAAFVSGLAADQAEYGIRLAGGDTAATPGPLTLAITAIGTVPAGKMMRRSTARPGEAIYVSGTLGDAALGLRVRRGGLQTLDGDARRYLEQRYRLPMPRVDLGPRLIGLAGAALDVSDGLVADLGHICETSGVAAIVKESALPLSAPAAMALAHDPELITDILAGGDDYEILFTAPASAEGALAEIGRALGLDLTRIGTIEAGSGVTIVRPDGRMRELPSGGWSHF